MVEEKAPRTAKQTLECTTKTAELVGKSRAFTQIIGLIERIATTKKTVLITGPTGAGKEVIAHHIHTLSTHKDAPFLDLNCGAIPEHLFEAELFGHVRGAFTGAQTDRAGYFEAVGNGTLFLDEIAELPQTLQAKLLRALETRTYRPVGANELKPFSGRIIAATHKDLHERVQSAQFREDLYHRLAVFEVSIPPLCERKDDIPALINHFMETQARQLQFTNDALQRLMNYTWPGNARELRNLIDRLCVLAEPDIVNTKVLEPFLRADNIKTSHRELARQLLQLEGRNKLVAAERLLIDYAMEQSNGNKTLAATTLGINRKVIERRLNVLEDTINSSKKLLEEGHSLVANGQFAEAIPPLKSVEKKLAELNSDEFVKQSLFQTYQLLGVCYKATEGWLNKTATQYHEKALSIGRDCCDDTDLATIQFGLWVSRLMVLELSNARNAAQEMILRAKNMSAPGILLDEARVAMANTLFWLGEFNDAQTCVAKTSFHDVPGAIRTGTQTFDLVGLALTFEGLSAFQAGNFDLAKKCANELSQRAINENDHFFNKAILLQGAAWLFCVFEDVEQMAPHAQALEAISRENNFVFYQGLGQIFCAYCEAQTDDAIHAEQKMRDGHENYMVKHGGKLFQSFQAWQRGELLLKAKRYDECIAFITLSIEQAIGLQERAYLSELMTVKAKAAVAKGDILNGEQELLSALALARTLGSVPAKIRLSIELAKLYMPTNAPKALTVLERALEGVENIGGIQLLTHAFTLKEQLH